MTEEPVVSILLPTLGRPEKVYGLVENVRDATGGWPWQLVFAIDRRDVTTWKALLKAVTLAPEGAVGAVAADGTYPVKTNAAYRFSSAPFVLPTADDVIFQAGWLDPIVAAFQDRAVQVVGTNDLSPMSNATHATMPVIRRSYIEDEGCSWDEPGLVFHEGYRHNFVETEICALAVQRGVWRYEPESVIEHLHPVWGKREADETDAVGNQAGFAEDQRVHEARKLEWSNG